MPCSCLPMPQV